MPPRASNPPSDAAPCARSGSRPRPDAAPHGAEPGARPELAADPWAGTAAPAAPPRGVELLAGSPREVLARIVPQDALGVRDVVADVLRAECLFLDADRVHLRALARVARAALHFPTSGLDLDAWLAAEVRAAAAEIVREEAESPRSDPGSAFVQFAHPLGLDPESLRRGCAAFHRLDLADRAAFCALVLRGEALESHARAAGASPLEIARRARRGLDAVLHASHPDLPPPARDVPGRRAVSPAPEDPR